jgi:hypothetical protein
MQCAPLPNRLRADLGSPGKGAARHVAPEPARGACPLAHWPHQRLAARKRLGRRILVTLRPGQVWGPVV